MKEIFVLIQCFYFDDNLKNVHVKIFYHLVDQRVTNSYAMISMPKFVFVFTAH